MGRSGQESKSAIAKHAPRYRTSRASPRAQSPLGKTPTNQNSHSRTQARTNSQKGKITHAVKSGKFANRQFQTKPENTRVCEPPKGRFLPTLPPQSLPLKYSSTRKPRQACTPRETKGKESWSSLQTSFRTGTKTTSGRKHKQRDKEQEQGTEGGRVSPSDVYCVTNKTCTAAPPSVAHTLAPPLPGPSLFLHRVVWSSVLPLSLKAGGGVTS